MDKAQSKFLVQKKLQEYLDFGGGSALQADITYVVMRRWSNSILIATFFASRWLVAHG